MDYSVTPDPEHISQEDWNIWLECAKPVLSLNATNRRFPNGGWNIQDNPELLDIVHKIGAMYLPYCIRKVEVMSDSAKKNHELMDSDSEVDPPELIRFTRRNALFKYLIEHQEVVISEKVFKLLSNSEALEKEIKRMEEGYASEGKNLRVQHFLARILTAVVAAANDIHKRKDPDAIRQIEGVIPRDFDPTGYASIAGQSIMTYTERYAPIISSYCNKQIL